MKKTLMFFMALMFISTSAIASNNMAKGLNVILTSKDAQTQMMAMVLSMMSLKQKKEVNLVLCSNAGDLAVKKVKSEVLKPMDKSPKMLLKSLINKGAKVQVCPLYLPNKGLKKDSLLKGIDVAKPMDVAKNLLNKEYQVLSY